MSIKKCVQCGRVFTLSESEEKFFLDKNLSIPKRCKECRERNKKKNITSSSDKPEKNEKVTYHKYNKRKNNISRYILGILLILSVIYACYNLNNYLSNYKDSNDSGLISLQNSSPEKTKNISPTISSTKKAEATKEASSTYTFRDDEKLTQHFNKHGGEFDYSSKEEYVAGANKVINSPKSLSKTEAEDGDMVYYLESTNEFVILSTDGYIRTYFKPDDGIEYYNRQ